MSRHPRSFFDRTKKAFGKGRLAFEPLESRLLMTADSLLSNQLLLTNRWGEIQTLKYDTAEQAASALAAYRSSGDFTTAEFDQRVSISVLPNDASFSTQYALRNTGQSGGTVDADIDADQAWDIRTGTLGTTVAVIDSGIDYTHSDLYLNIWVNQGELPTGLGLADSDSDGLITFWDLNASVNSGKVVDGNGNGRIDGYDVLHDSRWANAQDNDGNGKADDIIGWDFANNDNDPYDDNSHGTHCAGIIGATGNNSLGVSGVNWKVQIAGLKFLTAEGSGSTSAAVSALNYAVGEGIKISNNSWGGGGYSTTLANAIAAARTAGHIFLAAAGNETSNNDTVANYPSNYNYDNVVAVASTDRYDRLSSFSNYGATQVDLAAPGSSILSTVPGGGYASYSGTSMATPFVSGAVALLWGANPSMTYSAVVSRILSTVDAVASLSGVVATGGRLNVYNALSASTPDPTPPTTPTPVDTTGPRITAAAANGSLLASSVRLTFSEAIDPATFTTADITAFSGPQGALTATAVQVVAGTNNTQFDVRFASQTSPGAYAFTVGPDVRDTAGNRMDQNGNGTAGEGLDTYRAAFSVLAASTLTYTNATKVAIRDNVTVQSWINVAHTMTIADVNVKVNITHTWDADLRLYLRSPDGRLITLSYFRGGSGDNYTNTTFDDEAATHIANGRAPFTGSFRPENALSTFDGKLSTGRWTLYVQDNAAGDVGTLNYWSLTLSSAAGTTARSLAVDRCMTQPDGSAESRPGDEAVAALAAYQSAQGTGQRAMASAQAAWTASMSEMYGRTATAPRSVSSNLASAAVFSLAGSSWLN